MPELSFITCDVFTTRAFGGNPLAVFPAPPALEKTVMQALARELNLSETVFVYPGKDAATKRLRIFTPAREVPFAGHPIVGTAITLAGEGLLGEIKSKAHVTFEVEAGRVPISIERENDVLRATFTAPRAPQRVMKVPSREALASIVSLPAHRLAQGIEPQGYSAGLPFIFVPVKDRAALADARINALEFDRHVKGGEAVEVLVLTMEDWQRGNEIYARMFAPAAGIIEDAATGSAAAASAGFIAALRESTNGKLSWTIHQGIEMGRPSLISVSADIENGAAKSVEVGGAAVLMSRGSFSI